MRICFVSIDVEEDFSVPVKSPQGQGARIAGAGKRIGERKGFEGIERIDRILDIFKRVDVSTTLFTTGKVLENYPDKFKYLSELLTNQQTPSFEIACHTYSHKFWTNLSLEQRKEEVNSFFRVYQQVFGVGKKPAGFRAPSHLIDEPGIALLREVGFLYDSSVMPHYPFFKKYRGFQGKAPRMPYFPSPENCRRSLQQADRCKTSGGRVAGTSRILEIPVAGQLGGIPLAGAWISRIPHWFYKLLFSFSRPQFITVSMHPWDALDFEGRKSRPENFLNNLEKLLKLIKSRGYQFLTGEQVVRKLKIKKQNAK